MSEASAAAIAAARSRAAIFDMSASRGVLEVKGDDRVRWLDGMISGDVTALVAAAADARPGTGCYATLLTNKGAIVADLHVGCVGDVFFLESLRDELPKIAATLERFIIADDVTISDRSEAYCTLGLEGPDATTILSAALEDEATPPVAEGWSELRIAGADVLVAAFGFSGELAYQIRLAKNDWAGVEGALDAATGTPLVRGDAAALYVLRVEAGIPALGLELDEEVLPPEARLERAIATNKGCYVGQEIVARIRARGQVNHLLVGLTLADQAQPALGTELSAAGRKTGEITSVVTSPSVGAIALGYVRREHAEDGTVVEFEGGSATVSALPFIVGSGAAAIVESDGSAVSGSDASTAPSDAS